MVTRAYKQEDYQRDQEWWSKFLDTKLCFQRAYALRADIRRKIDVIRAMEEHEKELRRATVEDEMRHLWARYKYEQRTASFFYKSLMSATQN